MTFMSADAYDRFMGRFSEPLAEQFARSVPLSPGARALDVGCGPGALTTQLVRHLGADHVAAADPSPPFVEAAESRFPGVDVRRAAAEDLPFADDSFDVALAQLVVHFMADPVAGLAEMARVTRPGGHVAACVWDNAGASGPLSTFWRAVQAIDPQADGEAVTPGSSKGHLVELFNKAGLNDVEGGAVEVTIDFDTFEDWWSPYTLGVGPAGDYVAGLGAVTVEALRSECRKLLPSEPFRVRALAWSATGRA